MSKDEKKRVTYIKMKDKYLLIDVEGKTEVLNSKEEVDKYIKQNNLYCKRS